MSKNKVAIVAFIVAGFTSFISVQLGCIIAFFALMIAIGE